MADRVYVGVTCAAKDKDLVVEIFGGDPVDVSTCPSGAVNLGFRSVAWGGEAELADLAEHGVVLYGSHEAGESYVPMTFAVMDGDVKSFEQYLNTACIAVAFDIVTGEICPGDLEEAQKFSVFYREAKRRVHSGAVEE